MGRGTGSTKTGGSALRAAKTQPLSKQQVADNYNKALDQIITDTANEAIGKHVRGEFKDERIAEIKLSDADLSLDLDYWRNELEPIVEAAVAEKLAYSPYTSSQVGPADIKATDLQGNPIIDFDNIDSLDEMPEGFLEDKIYETIVDEVFAGDPTTIGSRLIDFDNKDFSAHLSDSGKITSNGSDPALILTESEDFDSFPFFISPESRLPGYGKFYAREGEPYREDGRPHLEMPNGTNAWMGLDAETGDYFFEKVELPENSYIDTVSGVRSVVVPEKDVNSRKGQAPLSFPLEEFEGERFELNAENNILTRIS